MAATGGMEIAAIVMASGFSRRLGLNKLLLPLGEGTVIGHVLEQIGRLGYSPVIVVSQYDEVLTQAQAKGFCPVRNASPAEGKSSSIRLGISALTGLVEDRGLPAPRGVSFFTGDQVLLSDKLLTGLQEAFRAAPDTIVFPAYDGAPGSPGTFPLDMAPRLMELRGEEGGMSAAKETPDRIRLVQAEPGWQGLDIDTAQTWERVLTLWHSEWQQQEKRVFG
ncbi:MAG: nucleotidyltransferase family protein [Clostridiales bacterium]|nr:nucleotidyltransferase family protein [Clostridiales bacterium]